jgi:hypothetical protein
MGDLETLREVTLALCGACLSGEGGECHTPGCSFWMNRAPDLPLMLAADGSCGRLLVGQGSGVSGLALAFAVGLLLGRGSA